MEPPPNLKREKDILEVPPHGNRGAGLVESLRFGGFGMHGFPFFYQALLYLVILGTIALLLLWFFW
jgi:hypothetical protein